jgi:16S rRNA (guanine1207-N2)-methyltransferase
MKRAPYELTLESRVADRQSIYRYHTADGVCSKHSFRTAELLLADALWGTDLGALLSLEANYGVVGTLLADSAASVRMVESSARAVQLCERNIIANDVNATTTLCADVASLNKAFDTIAYAPKPYTPLSIGTQRISAALSALNPDGTLYLTASKQTGLGRYEQCLRDVAATVEKIASRETCSVLKATRPRSFEPPTYVSPREIHSSVAGTTLSLVTVPGLFSAQRVDDGTRLLLKAVTVKDGERVLDICCGYGAIGTYAGRTADCEVWLSDDDRVATMCAECGLQASDVDGTVVTADCAEGVPEQPFERVLCNPPTHAGNDILSELFAGIRETLAPNGELAVVHHRELSLQRYLDQFNSVEELQTGDEHIVLSAHR